MGSLSIAPNSCANCTTDLLLVVLRNLVEAPETVENLTLYATSLQEEMDTIHGSKLHIPFTKALLTDAIEVVNEELDKYKNSKPVLKEFMPVKRSCGEKDGESTTRDIGHRDKNSLNADFNSNSLTLRLNNYKERDDQTKLLTSDTQSQSGKKGGRSRPSKGCLTFRSVILGKEEDVDGLLVSDLSLSTPETKNSRMGINAIASKPHCNRSGSSSVSNVQLNFKTEQQESGRKQRRCWSQELHQRFVRALEQLGGPQAATPKMIRELMQVDGLTNDEVKSHLQKFRLHTRRAATTGSSAPHRVGLLMPQESLKQCDSQSNSPNGPLQFGVEQDEGDQKPQSHNPKTQIPLEIVR